MKQPAIFVGHGSPMNVIEENNPFNQKFAEITRTFTKPKAILCISAHWYSKELEVQSGANPKMIYDFYGFPPQLSRVQYPASGNPRLAAQIQQLLAPEEVRLNPDRGYDHGAWAVLKHLYPEADIPVIQLSLDRTKPASWHFALAQKLKSLREQGVLILASGNIVHNLSALSYEHINRLDAGYDWAYEFRDQINRAIAGNNIELLTHIERLGWPAMLSVPTPEHYLPLLYVVAMREEQDNVELFNDHLVGGSLSMTSVFIG